MIQLALCLVMYGTISAAGFKYADKIGTAIIIRQTECKSSMLSKFPWLSGDLEPSEECSKDTPPEQAPISLKSTRNLNGIKTVFRARTLNFPYCTKNI